MRNSSKWARLVLGCAVVVGLVLPTLATRHGVGVTDDSVIYLAGAAEIREGKGFRLSDLPGQQGSPITNYPPLFSVAVAGIGSFTSTSDLEAARVLEVLCLGLSVALAGWLVFRYTASLPVAAGAALVTAGSPTMLEVHSAAWSEPLFLVLTGGGLAATSVYLESGKRYALWGAAALLGLAGLTRYAWPPFLAAGLLAVVVTRGVSLRSRLVDLTAYIALSVGPATAWAFRNLALGDQAFGWRSLYCELPSANHVAAAATTLGAWLVPGTDRIQVVPAQQQLLIAGLGAVVLAMAVAAVRQSREDARAPARFPAAFALVPPIYLGFLAFTISCVDDLTPLDQRTLSPIFIPSLVVCAHLIVGVYQRADNLRFERAAVIGGALFVAGYLAAGSLASAYLYQNGRGFGAPGWRYERLARWLEQAGRNVRLVSNHPSAIRYLYNRPARSMRNALGGVSAPEGFAVWFMDARQFEPTQAAAAKGAAPIDDAFAVLAPTLELVLEDRNARVYRLGGSER